MPGNKRNRQGEKGNDSETRTGSGSEESQYKKLPDNPKNRPDESISTRDNTANGKYSRTGKRDDEVDNDDTRGGR
jgi:hypothetical protein